MVAACLALAGRVATTQDQDPPDEEAIEARVSLPTDRLKERQLDRARRLIADERWSDAATLLDEMLAGDRDFFFRPQHGEATWRSIKTEAARLVGSLPAAGQAAYDLQFRARADRLLQNAVAAGDAAGIVAVARRWFHTPAGRRATLVAALEALDADQPLAAAAWLERLATGGGAEFEPTLSVMRAVAWWRAGDRRVALAVLDEARRRGGTALRVGGREVSLALPQEHLAAWLASAAGAGPDAADRRDAEWWLARGDAARNARVEASRPLLVPRYRVPLTRHPEEARLLEKRRRASADRDAPLIPAGSPLAIDGTLVLHSPLGLLAVDFVTGKRVWMRGAAALDAGAAQDADVPTEGEAGGTDGLQRVFSDATSGVVSSNGRLVYAIESLGRERRGTGVGRGGAALEVPGGNVLAAYDIAARGAPAWRRPTAEAAAAEGAVCHLGAPLAIGDQLFVLVEERGEVRLDVLGASDGTLRWSQPLAELDEEQQADRPETLARRSAGLSPAFADGVLVCPTGAGTVIAVDLATRTLLWAYNYATSSGDTDAGRPGQRGPLGMMRRVIVNGVPVGEAGSEPTGWRDACPVVASGRVLLTPIEADTLHCLDLRTGALRWTAPRGDAMYVAGIVDGRAIVVGSHTVEGLALDSGASVWPKPLAFGPAAVSGRGVLSPRRLFLPLDTPEVIEIDLDTGGIVGRSPARGGVIPGNLVAYRGEIVSQGVDFLDVFHQVAPLEERIETAARARADDPWVRLWRGQLELDAGRITEGLTAIAAARRADPARVPADLVADALLFGMRRDFAAAAPLWRTLAEVAGPLPRSKALQCIAIDNQLATGACADAWSAYRALLELPPAVPSDDDWLIEDVSAPGLVVSEPRWLQGRLRDLVAKAQPALRQEIDATLAAAVERVRESAPADHDPIEAWSGLATRFATHPAGVAARRMLLESIEARLASSSARDAGRLLAVRRDLLLLAEQRAGDGAAPPGTALRSASEGPWPLGRVGVQRSGRRRDEDAMRFSRTIPIPLDARSRSVVPGLQVGCDIQAQALIVSDGFGRRIGEPIPFDPGRNGGLNPLFQPLNAEAIALGPLLLVRSGGGAAAGGAFAAFDVRGVAGPPPERLWLVSDGAAHPAELPGFGIHVGRGGWKLKRNGNAPLGMRVAEPEPPAGSPAGSQADRGMLLVAAGAALVRDHALELRDPASGVVAWRRGRLPAVGELIGDDEFLCVCPRDGRQATVVATADGRLIRTCTVPAHDLRLASAGRRIIAIAPTGAGAGTTTGTVTLECLDPARDERIGLGEFSGSARATQAGPDLLAILEPEGTLTVVDIERGAVRFRTTLPEMPAGLEHLQVLAWQDRLLVMAGRRETPQEQAQFEKLGHVSPLPQMVPGDDASGQVFTGSIWAVSRSSGEPLWSVPATLVRHCLQRHQPAELPVLVFARHLHSRRDGNAVRLGMLLLDKRTGHAVYADDRMPMQPHVLAGCDVSGDPERHTVTLGRAGGDATEIKLEFSGEPMAPRPPYQAATRPAGGGDFVSELESWLHKALTIPLPF